MTRLLLLFCLSLSCLASTFEVTKVALVRNKRFRPKHYEVKLTDLLSEDRFEGKYFKIVKGISEEAISFDDQDTWLVFKAATTYYHLTKAREYFVNHLKSDYVQGLEQLTIRLDITRTFNELGHYAHIENPPQYNNALSIPEGEGYQGRVPSWGKEIWFRPPSPTHISEIEILDNGQTAEQIVRAFRNQNLMTSFQRFMIEYLNHEINDRMLNEDNLIRTAGTTLIMELVYRNQDSINRLLSRKWYELDTALVPEIIYHEFSHIALSDYLELSHSTSVIEGMADYFAGKIANSDKLATHIKAHNTFDGKKAKRKQFYQQQFELTDYANADFVFGILWGVGDIIGENQETFIYQLRENVKTTSSIRGQLIDGLLTSCRFYCENPLADSVAMRIFLSQKNL